MPADLCQPPLPDEVLLRDFVQNNSPDACAKLVARYHRLVHGVARRLLPEQESACDVTQEVFLQFVRHAGRVDPKRLGAWLHRTARNVSLNTRRGKLRRHHREQIMSILTDDSPAASAAIVPDHWADALEHLDDALDGLSGEERECLIARFYHERPLREIGEAAGKSEDAARMMVSRALQKVSSLLRRRGIAIPAAALAGGISAEFSKAAPPLSAAALSALTRSATKSAASAASRFAILTLTFMAKNSAMIAAALVLLLAGLGAGYWIGHRDAPAGPASSLTSRIVPPAVSTPKPITAGEAKASHEAAGKPVAWDALNESDRITVKLSRDTILNADIRPLENRTELTLSDAVRELLGLTDEEAARVNAALRTSEQGIRAIEHRKLKRVKDLPNGVVFEIPAFAEEARPLRDQLFAEVQAAIGEKRAQFLLPKVATATDWRLARFGIMKRRYTVDFQNEAPVIEADGTRRTTELLQTRIDFERGDSLDDSQAMVQDGPFLGPVAMRRKGIHAVMHDLKELGNEVGFELNHLFSVEDLKK